ncbi:UNVERIFIED_CONTAM: hypothetical protein PYX00_009566 [Menopon gallinae]|uniref:G-protein coupled receptors family 2 profile 2 domain-containing protein n=1 Tax=Menopon gallinae TaxID=328185 RepID=A0AAW2HBW7_9NEOP
MLKIYLCDIVLSVLFLNLINLTIVKCEDSVFRIRKCCAENELILERTGRCTEFKLLHANKHIYHINETDEGARFLTDINEDMQGLRPWWFPPQSDILSIKNNQSLMGFPKNYKVISGQGQPCEESETSFLPAYFYKYSFYDDGSIVVHPQKGLLESPIRFDPLSFCIDRIELEDDVSKDENFESVLDIPEVGDYMVMLCPCKKATCVLKCCELGMLFDMHDDRKDSCSLSDEVDDWSPVYLKDSDSAPDYFLLHGLPDCNPEESVVIPNYPDADNPGYIIFSNGTARIDGETFINQPLQFCGENFVDGKDGKVRNHILRCYPKNGVPDQWKIVQRILYGWASIVGAIFLFLTLFIHYSLPSLRKLNDKCIICQTWSLFSLHVSVAIANLATLSSHRRFCTLIGFLIQYSSLAAFFWLNVLCFDISYTFSSFRIARGSYTVITRRKQIFYYIYGWITPALIVGLTATVEYFPSVAEYLVKPEFSKSCWFRKDSIAQILYFYGPIAILLAINFFLFVYTMVKIIRARREISSTIRNRSQENKRFILYLKLFILMGVSWIMELISWAVGGPVYYWFLPDIINLLRSVFIFVSLCWKKQVIFNFQIQYLQD